MKKAFTLIELLIVVAIIAILAAIAVPNFLEAQTRAKVARVMSDQRTYATALETYQIDYSSYPAYWGTGILTPPVAPPGVTDNINSAVLQAAGAPGPAVTKARNVPSFAFKNGTGTIPPLSLTTPVSYLNTYVPDTFGSEKQSTFGYVTGQAGFLIWSPGPDTADQLALNTAQTGATHAAEYIIRGGDSLPSAYLITGPGGSATKPPSAPTTGDAYTYDATNGTSSAGDTYRTK